MKNKKILLVTQEMIPYVELSSIAKTSRYLAPFLQQKKSEIRLLMPRFGNINEKRHRLHEVVRLSGMNIIVGDDDIPLIIKVASLQDAKMQVYFLDNDELFSRKNIFRDDNNEFFNDNNLRMIFFCKGVLETVKKLGWKPDIIHCHGWMTSLIPLYINKVYKDEPILSSSKVIYSVYENSFSEKLNSTFISKAKIDDSIEEKDLNDFRGGTFNDLNIGAINNADAVVVSNENIDPELKKYIKGLKNKPILQSNGENGYLDAHYDFYKKLLSTN